MDSGRGSADRGDASDTREPGFESSHHQLLLNNRFLKTVEIKGKDVVNGPLKEISLNTSTKWLPYYMVWMFILGMNSHTYCAQPEWCNFSRFRQSVAFQNHRFRLGQSFGYWSCFTDDDDDMRYIFSLFLTPYHLSLSLSFSLSLIRSHVLTVIPTREVLRYSFYNAGESSYFTYSFYISTY